MNESEQAKAACREVVNEMKELFEMLQTAESVQWSRPRKPESVVEGETGTRSSRPIADPTGETAIDDSRLILRDRVRETQREAMKAAKAIKRSRWRLQSALRPWL